MVDGQSITLQPRDSFESAIRATAELGIDARWQHWDDKPRRMDGYSPHGPLHLMNFVTAEYIGPGRTGQSTRVSPIRLQDNEYFAHETAALYDPAEGILLLESSLGGMGPGAIKTYFRRFDRTCIISLRRRVDDEAVAKARRFQVFRQLHLRVSMGSVSQIERQSGTEVLQSLGEGFHAQEIDIVIKASRTKGASLTEELIRPIIEAVRQQKDKLNYERVRVYGREEEDERFELIDIVSEPLKSEQSLFVDPETRKVSHEDKWEALINMHDEFTQR